MNTIRKLDSLNETHVISMELAYTDMRIRVSTIYAYMMNWDQDIKWSRQNKNRTKSTPKKARIQVFESHPKLTFGDYEMQSHEYEIVLLHQPLLKYSMSDTVRTNMLEAALLEKTHTYQRRSSSDAIIQNERNPIDI